MNHGWTYSSWTVTERCINKWGWLDLTWLTLNYNNFMKHMCRWLDRSFFIRVIVWDFINFVCIVLVLLFSRYTTWPWWQFSSIQCYQTEHCKIMLHLGLKKQLNLVNIMTHARQVHDNLKSNNINFDNTMFNYLKK